MVVQQRKNNSNTERKTGGGTHPSHKIDAKTEKSEIKSQRKNPNVESKGLVNKKKVVFRSSFPAKHPNALVVTFENDHLVYRRYHSLASGGTAMKVISQARFNSFLNHPTVVGNGRFHESIISGELDIVGDAAEGNMAQRMAQVVLEPEKYPAIAWPSVSTNKLSVLSNKTTFTIPYKPLFTGVLSTDTYESVVYSEGRGIFGNCYYTSSTPAGTTWDAITATMNINATVTNDGLSVFSGNATYNVPSLWIEGRANGFTIKSPYDQALGTYNAGYLSGPMRFNASGSELLNYPCRNPTGNRYLYPITAPVGGATTFIYKLSIDQPGTYIQMNTYNNGNISGANDFLIADGDWHILTPQSNWISATTNAISFRVFRYDGGPSAGEVDLTFAVCSAANTITAFTTKVASAGLALPGTAQNPQFTVHSSLLAAYDVPYATRLPFEGIVQTCQSLRMTSTASTLNDRGAIAAGNLPPRTTLGELAYPGFRGLVNITRTYSGAHKDGGYAWQLPNSTPYYLESLSGDQTERPNICIIAQTTYVPGDVAYGVLPSHEVTVAAHFMGSCIDNSYGTVSTPVGYQWYDVFISVLENAQNGSENPGHVENARRILKTIAQVANSQVAKFAVDALGAVAPRAGKVAGGIRNATAASAGFLADL